MEVMVERNWEAKKISRGMSNIVRRKIILLLRTILVNHEETIKAVNP